MNGCVQNTNETVVLGWSCWLNPNWQIIFNVVQQPFIYYSKNLCTDKNKSCIKSDTLTNFSALKKIFLSSWVHDYVKWVYICNLKAKGACSRQAHEKCICLASGGMNFLLYRYECFTVKYANRRFYMKLHPGYEWHIFAGVIPLFFLCFSSIFFFKTLISM